MNSRTTAGDSRPDVAVIGGGFCGLAAAYELGRRGVCATVLECDAEVGGLAGSFPAAGARLEKFYDHLDGFNFDLRDHLLDGRVCVAKRELPVRDYAIVAIRTGQVTGEGQKIWEGSFDLAGSAGDEQAAP